MQTLRKWEKVEVQRVVQDMRIIQDFGLSWAKPASLINLRCLKRVKNIFSISKNLQSRQLFPNL